MFKITRGKGFHIRFDNGWTASVQWGPANYCDNRGMNWSEDELAGEQGSTTAEVAAWPEGGGLSSIPGGTEGDTVGAYYTSEKALDFFVEGCFAACR